MDVPIDEIRTLMKSNGLAELQRAVMGIGFLKDRALKRELLLELLHCSQQQVRRMALDQLASVGGEEVIQPLQDVLRNDSEPYFRALAAKHLGELPDKGTMALLLAAYQEADEDLKIAAAGSLYRYGHPGEVADLAPRLAADLDSPDGSVRKDAVRRLSRLQSPLTIPFLTRALRDSNGDVRSEAVSALEDLDTPELPSLLEPLLQDPYSDVREYAQDAIENYRKKHPK
jgi:HEAT repeat protein